MQQKKDIKIICFLNDWQEQGYYLGKLAKLDPVEFVKHDPRLECICFKKDGSSTMYTTFRDGNTYTTKNAKGYFLHLYNGLKKSAIMQNFKINFIYESE